MKFFTKDGRAAFTSEISAALTKAFGEENMYDLCFEFVLELGAVITAETCTAEVTPEVVEQYIKSLENKGEIDEDFIKFIRKYQPFVDGTLFQFHTRK